MSEYQTDQRKQILEKAATLFMTIGIKSVSMDDIAKQLGISKKTIYQYVENKNDLLSSVIHDFTDRYINELNLKRSVAQNAIEEMHLIGKHITGHLRDISNATMHDLQKYYRKEWEIIQDLHKKDLFKIIKENLERGQKEGLYRLNLHSEIIAKMYVESSFIIVNENIFPLKIFTREDLIKEFLEYHIHGVVTDKGHKILKQQNT